MISAPMAMSGRPFFHPPDQRDGKIAVVPPLHPFQDQIVTGLKRQMDMRHEARFAGDDVEQPLVNLYSVD